MITRELRLRRLTAVAIVALIASGVEADAQPPATARPMGTAPAVVVRLANEAKIPHDILLPAQQRAGEIYENAGVSVIWRDIDEPDGWAAGAGSVEVLVILASTRLTAAICGINRVEPHAMGAAMMREHRMAYVFTERIEILAARKNLMASTIVGEVIAHEIGHLLLRDATHAKAGVMRATVNSRFHAPPQFTAEQAATLRARLTQP